MNMIGHACIRHFFIPRKNEIISEIHSVADAEPHRCTHTLRVLYIETELMQVCILFRLAA